MSSASSIAGGSRQCSGDDLAKARSDSRVFGGRSGERRGQSLTNETPWQAHLTAVAASPAR
eukprot:7189342-Pyramimonas_sp.AAC.1